MAEQTNNVEITRINGKNYVAGLMWETLSSVRNYIAEARTIGKRDGMDIVAIRRGLVIQAGFVSKKRGALKGMYSLASALSGLLGPSWVGVFALPNDRYALVAVHKNSIVPSCDVIGSRDEMFYKLQVEYGQFQFDKVYAPKDFGYGGEEIRLEDVLTSAKISKHAQLKPLTFGLTGKERLLLAVALGTVLSAFYGYDVYTDWVQKKTREEAARLEAIRQAELVKLKATMSTEVDDAKLVFPWVSMPTAKAFLARCIPAVREMPVAVNGWVFWQASCNNGTLSAVYNRQPGATAAALLAVARSKFGVDPTVAANSNTAEITKPLDMEISGDEVLQAESTFLIDYASFFQGQDISATFQNKVPVAQYLPPVVAEPGQPAPVMPAPWWKVYSLKYESGVQPDRHLKALDMAGFRFDMVTVQMDQLSGELKWTVSGEMYVK